MKRRYIFAIIATIILIALSVTNVAAANNVNDDQYLAKQAGISFINDGNIIKAHTQWQGATLGEGISCYDPKGRVIAYDFPIQKTDQQLGHIIVGSSLYKYLVLESSESQRPQAPSEAELITVAKRDLNVDVSSTPKSEPKYLYLGYASYYSVYSLGKNTIAFDLRTRQAYTGSALTSSLLSPEEYASKTQVLSPLSSTAYWLDVPIQRMDDSLIPPGHRNNNNCGPTSGAMVDEFYYQSRGYSRFANPVHTVGVHSWPDDEEDLYSSMHCNVGTPGTLPPFACSGFSAYATSKNYSFSTYYDTAYDWDFTNRVVRHINANQPYMVLFRSSPYYPPGQPCLHWCTMSGWNTVDSARYIWVNNPWGTKWDQVSFDLNYPYLTWAEMWPTGEPW